MEQNISYTLDNRLETTTHTYIYAELHLCLVGEAAESWENQHGHKKSIKKTQNRNALSQEPVITNTSTEFNGNLP